MRKPREQTRTRSFSAAFSYLYGESGFVYLALTSKVLSSNFCVPLGTACTQICVERDNVLRTARQDTTTVWVTPRRVSNVGLSRIAHGVEVVVCAPIVPLSHQNKTCRGAQPNARREASRIERCGQQHRHSSSSAPVERESRRTPACGNDTNQHVRRIQGAAATARCTRRTCTHPRRPARSAGAHAPRHDGGARRRERDGISRCSGRVRRRRKRGRGAASATRRAACRPSPHQLALPPLHICELPLVTALHDVR